MLGMVEIGKHQFLIEGRVKALPFLTGFTLLDYSNNKEYKVDSMIGISVPIRVTSIPRILNIVDAPFSFLSLSSASKRTTVSDLMGYPEYHFWFSLDIIDKFFYFTKFHHICLAMLNANRLQALGDAFTAQITLIGRKWKVV
jgi:hypothetical protein